MSRSISEKDPGEPLRVQCQPLIDLHHPEEEPLALQSDACRSRTKAPASQYLVSLLDEKSNGWRWFPLGARID